MNCISAEQLSEGHGVALGVAEYDTDEAPAIE
jgi:hypothetical protein